MMIRFRIRTQKNYYNLKSETSSKTLDYPCQTQQKKNWLYLSHIHPIRFGVSRKDCLRLGLKPDKNSTNMYILKLSIDMNNVELWLFDWAGKFFVLQPRITHIRVVEMYMKQLFSLVSVGHERIFWVNIMICMGNWWKNQKRLKGCNYRADFYKRVTWLQIAGTLQFSWCQFCSFLL